MKNTNAFIVAALAASMLTSCGNSGNAEVTDQTTDGTSSVSEELAAKTEEITTTEGTTTEESIETILENDEDMNAEEETTTEESTETAAKELAVDVEPPSREFLAYLFDNWGFSDIGASPSSDSYAFYIDIDGDSIKEFCFVVGSLHGYSIAVFDYDNDNREWKYRDSLQTAYEYTYLQPNEKGAARLFIVDGVRYLEGLYSYIYENGEIKPFELKGTEKLSDDSLVAEYNDDPTRVNDLYHNTIKEALIEYDDLTWLYDLPHAETDGFYDIYVPDVESSKRDEAKLDEFYQAVLELF